MAFRENMKLARAAQIVIGDVYREQGKYGEAMTAYKAARELAATVDEREKRNPDFEKIRQGQGATVTEHYLMRVEAWLRRLKAKKRKMPPNLLEEVIRYTDGALKVLMMWEFLYPDEKLRGYSSTLRARALIIQGEYIDAIHYRWLLRECEAFVKAATSGGKVIRANNYVPEALIYIGRANVALGKKKEAIAAFDRVVKDFPESPHVDDAKKRATALRK